MSTFIWSKVQVLVAVWQSGWLMITTSRLRTSPAALLC